MLIHEYRYWAQVVRVIDGDSIVVDVDLGFDNWEHDMHVRLAGIDAPERWTLPGKAARDFVSALLPPGTQVYLTSEQYNPADKFGRCLAMVQLEGEVSLQEMIIEHGHAVPYDGGRRT